jgi:hypothetical protein
MERPATYPKVLGDAETIISRWRAHPFTALEKAVMTARGHRRRSPSVDFGQLKSVKADWWRCF